MTKVGFTQKASFLRQVETKNIATLLMSFIKMEFTKLSILANVSPILTVLMLNQSFSEKTIKTCRQRKKI